MASDEEFMRKAVEKVREGIRLGQTPFGACIVKDGRIVSRAHNTVWIDGDITAHAEINAIRKACKKLGTVDLSGCVIYSTTEPCPMCFSACHWAKIDKIVYGAKISDAADSGFSELSIPNERMKMEGGSDVEIVGGVLGEECRRLFGEWKGNGEAKTY
ncbi:MAG TPA: nucleoside deaminase [Candidatus Altiarchaeales archaeon]|nr:nucleoside deaminase [Candidatus Altiarchaeales archaeon]